MSFLQFAYDLPLNLFSWARDVHGWVHPELSWVGRICQKYLIHRSS